MAGLSNTGFTTKRLEEILQSYKDAAQSIYQDLVAPDDYVDTGSNSALGRLIGIVGPSDADLWEAIQQVYNAFDPRVATGDALDAVTAIGGITRLAGAASTVYQLDEADYLTTIPTGSQVRNIVNLTTWQNNEDILFDRNRVYAIALDPAPVANNTLYQVGYTTLQGVVRTLSFTSDATATRQEIIDGLMAAAGTATHSPYITTYILDGYLYIEAVDYFGYYNFTVSGNIQTVRVKKLTQYSCTTFGANESAINQITAIATPVVGWLNTTNPFVADIGRLEETDDELRARFEDSKSLRGSDSVDAIYTAVYEIPGVNSIKIIENDTNVTDANGILRNSIMVIVRGGNINDIAKVIFDNKAAGVRTQGNTTVSVNDTLGNPHNINFEVPEHQMVYINMNISVDTTFPSDGVIQIKQALTEYFKSFDAGDDVIYSRLYTPINSVSGFQVNDLEIGFSQGVTSASNLVIDFNKIAYTDPNFITIIE